MRPRCTRAARRSPDSRPERLGSRDGGGRGAAPVLLSGSVRRGDASGCSAPAPILGNPARRVEARTLRRRSPSLSARSPSRALRRRARQSSPARRQCREAVDRRRHARRPLGLAQRHPILRLLAHHDGCARARGGGARADDRGVRPAAPADRRAARRRLAAGGRGAAPARRARTLERRDVHHDPGARAAVLRDAGRGELPRHRRPDRGGEGRRHRSGLGRSDRIEGRLDAHPARLRDDRGARSRAHGSRDGPEVPAGAPAEEGDR